MSGSADSSSAKLVAEHILTRENSFTSSPGGTAMQSIFSPDGTSKSPLQRHHIWNQYEPSEIKVLLLENVHPIAKAKFVKAGYQVETVAGSISEQDLVEKLKDIHILGIRSKTKMHNPDLFKNAKKLLCIGCFCIGTNQVDFKQCNANGIAIFNSPYQNSRSVAELTIANMINLARQLGDRNTEMHAGTWNKVSAKCHEIRGKTLGIIGYGHIGTQLSVLAESMGLRVVYYDVVQIMPLGTASQVLTLAELLETSDFITLHVPETPDTKNLITINEFTKMKPNCFFINASRGNVVNIPDLVTVLNNGHLGGACIDVFPTEPSSNGTLVFDSPLQKCRNTILTPHIGGCTEEAQLSIGIEVANSILNYVNQGVSAGSVNLPNLILKPLPVDNPLTIRLSNIHLNVPGVLRKINLILKDFNIQRQSSDSVGEIAYLVADVTLDSVQLLDQLRQIHTGIESLEENVLVRIFY